MIAAEKILTPAVNAVHSSLGCFLGILHGVLTINILSVIGAL